MSSSICRWGILGTATIARKNWQSIRNAENATLVAIASRDRARSEQYINECQTQVPFDQVPRALGSYEELLASEDVDAVYLPLPTSIRKAWVVRAAEAGKHVLCEKPCGNSVDDVAEMVDVCARNNVQFMDGVMFMHSGRLQQMREALDAKESIGDIRRIASQFSFCAPDDFIQGNIRTSSKLEPLGCLGDLGWYNIRFTLWAMNWQMPERVRGYLHSEMHRDDSPQPVPMEFSGELFFANGVSTSFYCSFITEHQQWAHVSGTRGYLHVPDFVLPYDGSEVAFEISNHVFNLDGCNFSMQQNTRRLAVVEYSDSHPNAQETNLFRNFSDIVLSGNLDPFWPKTVQQTQHILNACLDSARSEGEAVAVIS